jgi:hypothetical protein
MNDADRFRLLGTYKTPRFRRGDTVFCDVRGEVVLVGLSAGRTPWPVGQRGSARSLAVFGGLAEAVRRESATAVCYWWGITAQTVTRWRRALGVGPVTEGTHRLKSANALQPAIVAAREKARARARDPARCAKIAVSRRGKPRPAHVIEAMATGRRGKPHDIEVRQRMSESHKKRGTRPPMAGPAWEAWEDAAVRTLPAAEAARRTGRTLTAVYSRRRVLEMPDGRTGWKATRG